MGTGELLGKPDEMLVGGNLVMDWHQCSMLNMWNDILALGSSNNDFCVYISFQKTCPHGLCHSTKPFY